MKDLRLFEACRNKVSMRVSGGQKETDLAIKKIFGIEPVASNTGFPTNQVISLIKNARERSLEYVKRSPECFSDPVNEHMASQLGYRIENILNASHPLDEAFDLIKAAADLSAKEAARDSFCRTSVRFMDQVNDHGTGLIGSGNKRGYVDEIFSLIGSIFNTYTPSGRAKLKLDPVDEMYSNGFPCEPVHSLAEWNDLIKEAAGLRPETYEEILARSGDPVNDFAADIFGHERPSATALKVIEDKILYSCYEVNKLKPGTEAHAKKEKEIVQLQHDRDIRKANLEAADKNINHIKF